MGLLDFLTSYIVTVSKGKKAYNSCNVNRVYGLAKHHVIHQSTCVSSTSSSVGTVAYPQFGGMEEALRSLEHVDDEDDPDDALEFR